MTRQTMRISGMTCGNCMRHVDAALRAIPGVTVEDVRVGSATVAFDEATVAPALLVDAVEDAGYDVTETVPAAT